MTSLLFMALVSINSSIDTRSNASISISKGLWFVEKVASLRPGMAHVMSDSQAQFDGPESTVVTVGEKTLTITRQDMQEMKAALLKTLRAVELEDRDYLIRMTERVPGWIDHEGKARIGGWLLEAKPPNLALVFRIPSGNAIRHSYVGFVKRPEQQWVVTEIQPERAFRRR